MECADSDVLVLADWGKLPAGIAADGVQAVGRVLTLVAETVGTTPIRRETRKPSAPPVLCFAPGPPRGTSTDVMVGCIDETAPCRMRAVVKDVCFGVGIARALLHVAQTQPT